LPCSPEGEAGVVLATVSVLAGAGSTLSAAFSPLLQAPSMIKPVTARQMGMIFGDIGGENQDDRMSLASHIQVKSR
jgi:hypothetical protein